MTFVHDDSDFRSLIVQVSDETRVSPALVEKDYWIAHCLWAIQESGLEIWFKGGTSLSKGFGIIERFSEDLDLMIEKGRAAVLPDVSNWSSLNKGPVGQRLSFYKGLENAMEIPAVRVERVTLREDKYGRGADYLGMYPGLFVSGLPGVMSASVRFEVGRARVVPFVERPISSFVHDYLERQKLLGGFTENRPRVVRCVHPLVTLLEKLDALSRRYSREPMEADGFVRHYEDAARIVQSLPRLAPAGVSAMKLAQDMLAEKDIVRMPASEDASLMLDDPAKRSAIELAYTRIGPMFWGGRIALDAACETIRQWVDRLED